MKKTIILCLLMATATCGWAQVALRGAYFSENSMMRHELNPAFTPGRGYASIFNVNATVNSSIGLDKVLYPSPKGDGTLVTFMHESVNSDFLNSLSTNNAIGEDLNLLIGGVGFMGFGGFNSIGISLRNNVYGYLPKGLFEFMKLGQQGESTTYSFDNLGVETDTYVELAFGHQHNIGEHWSVGGKLKLLVGMAYANMNVQNMTMTTKDNMWEVHANGEMQIAVKGLTIPTNGEAGKQKADRPRYNEAYALDEMKYKSGGVSGFGVALDLGVDYKAEFLEGLDLSLALLDLGFINYTASAYGTMNNNEPWTFEGFHICSNENEPGHEGHETFSNQWNSLGNELADYLNFKKTEKSSFSHALAATLNIGASYKMPFYNRLKLGFLSSTRIYGRYSWSEGRFIANINPVKGLDASVNFAVSSWGTSFGWLLNYTTTGFGIFLGMDHTLGSVTKQFVPLSGRANLALGISFPFSKKK
ncbi:MAG: hypothetical protein HUK00_04450 [Bacteroidaceae bacterium]|nr:hypothetical protein [Bacteroidaceae bacterium]